MSVIFNNPTVRRGGIVKDGLVLNLDAADTFSYSKTGNTWFDLSGNGNHNYLLGGTSYDNANNCITLNGGLNYIEANANTSLTTTQKEGSLTYEYWLQPLNTIKTGYSQTNTGTNFYSPGSPSNQGLGGDTAYNYGLTSSIYVGLGFVFGTNGFVLGVHKNGYAPTILVDYQTYTGIKHLVVVKNVTDCSYYVNGVFKKSSLSIAGGATIIGDSMRYVTANTGSFTSNFTGKIYKVNYYTKALSADEISQNFDAHRGRFGI